MPRPSKLVALLALSALVVAPAVLAGRQSARSVRTRQRRGTCKTTTTTTPASPDPAPSLPVVVDDDQRQTWCSTATPPLDPSLVQKIKDNLEERGNQSWVSGIRMQAYLELDTPSLSVFNPTYLPIAQDGSVENKEVNGIAKYWLDLLSPDSPNMVDDGEAAGDTAAPGVFFLNAAKTASPTSDRKRYTLYANRNVQWLLEDQPRLPNGGIGHNNNGPNGAPQMWTDFNYFVPPFFAYWGVLNSNITVAREAYNQIKYYRELLRDPDTHLWKHTTNNGDWEDPNFWGTGMGYTAGGMIRTYVTLKYSPFATQLEQELSDLVDWTNELLEACFKRVSPTTGLLPISYDSAENPFDDAGHSAFLVSVTYRLSDLGLLKNEEQQIKIADGLRIKVYDTLNKETGWLPAARRYELRQEHPQALGFLLLMEAAARDYGKACKS